MLPRNDRLQFPVLSMMYPPTSGETMAAAADPTFIRPLAEPEKRGAISMGMAHMGPMVNSAKKNAALRQRAAIFRSCTYRIGSIQPREHRKPATTRLRRAVFRLPVLRKTQSLTTPPAVSPITPAKKTPAENNADFFRSR